MSNSRAFRRRLAVTRETITKRRQAWKTGRWPFGGPSLSSVRRWMKQLEAAGRIERCGVQRTGKPGRPAQLWRLTAAARKQPLSKRSANQQIVDLRVERLLKRARSRGLTEDQIVAAYEDAMAPVKEDAAS